MFFAFFLRVLRILRLFFSGGGNLANSGNFALLTNSTIQNGSLGVNPASSSYTSGNPLGTYAPYATAQGGGVWNESSGIMELDGCMVTGNQALVTGTARGGGIANEGSFTLNSSIITNNMAQSLHVKTAQVGHRVSTVYAFTAGEGGGFFNARGAYYGVDTSTQGDYASQIFGNTQDDFYQE